MKKLLLSFLLLALAVPQTNFKNTYQSDSMLPLLATGSINLNPFESIIMVPTKTTTKISQLPSSKRSKQSRASIPYTELRAGSPSKLEFGYFDGPKSNRMRQCKPCYQNGTEETTALRLKLMDLLFIKKFFLQ